MVAAAPMAEAALVIYAFYLGSAFLWRSWTQWRATGSSGFVGIRGRPGSLEWLAGVLFVGALALGIAAPVLALVGTLEPLAALDAGWVGWVGVVLAVGGVAATLDAQVAMGRSWRIGVDPSERTDLVIDGPFKIVRNPIFAAMIPTGCGLALMVPNAVALVGFVALLAALELQVRVVEEPYLVRTHGSDYLSYAARVGRFCPGIGTLREPRT